MTSPEYMPGPRNSEVTSGQCRAAPDLVEACEAIVEAWRLHTSSKISLAASEIAFMHAASLGAKALSKAKGES